MNRRDGLDDGPVDVFDLNLGDIGGIPRVLDASQCNDSHSLAVIALKLKKVFGLEDINELPISYDIASLLLAEP